MIEKESQIDKDQALKERKEALIIMEMLNGLKDFSNENLIEDLINLK